MNRSLRIRAGIVIVVILASLYGLYPTIQSARISDEDRVAAQTDPVLKAKIDGIESKAIRKGLDLEGGMYIVLEIDDEGMTPAQAGDALDRVVEILRNRVDQFGVSEPDIKPMGTTRIIVQLPGLQDVERAKSLIGTTARLDFRLVRPADEIESVFAKLDEAFKRSAAVVGDTEVGDTEEIAEPVEAAADTSFEGLAPLPAAGTEFDEDDPYVLDHPFSAYVYSDPSFQRYFGTPLFVESSNLAKVREMLASPEARVVPRSVEFQFFKGETPVSSGMTGVPLFLVNSRASLTGDRLTGARANPDSDHPGNWQVSLNLDHKGARLFSKVTGENVGRQLAISLDGKIQLAPTIQSKIPSGTASITGGYTNVGASDLALLLRAGALPVDVRIEQERTVGPSLGADSIRQGLNAAIYGLILVIIFVILYYRLSGLVVVLALIVNMVIMMAVLAQFGLVLTLPGIAGIILTIGMAVDANVLINERIREELRRNKTSRAAVDAGYSNATRTIVDANVTTLIAAAILLWFGTGPIQGFAVTLTIGIISSMFTALVLTRVIMEAATRNRANAKISI